MTAPDDFDQRVDDLIAEDPVKIRAEMEREVRARRPDVTQDELDAEWGVVQATLGL